MYYAVHQHTMPNATALVIFFSLHKLYHSPLIICLHWLPSCLLTPHFKLLILCLKTKHNLSAPCSAVHPLPPSRATHSLFCSSSLSAFVSQMLFPASLQLLFTPLTSLSYVAFLRDTSHFFFLYSHQPLAVHLVFLSPSLWQ